jgi:hypothetical protein
MNAGNTMPAPGPINELPGLNALMVFGENMQAVIGLNHQLSIGNNHQICINPFGLLAGVPGIPLPAAIGGAMGAGMGGNIELTLGASASVTMGQAFEISLGKKKINIEGRYKDHKLTVMLCGVLAAAAIAYAIGYGLKNANNQYIDCGNFTIAYQAVVDATLIAIMVVENMFEESEDEHVFALNELFGVKQEQLPEFAATATGWLAGCTAGLALLGAIAVPLALAEKDSQVGDQQSAADAPAGGGSGGGDDDGDDEHSVVGKYTVTAEGVEIISRTPLAPAIHGRNVITLVATGETETGEGKGGYVEVRGNAGVRITAGPPVPVGPSTSSDQTNGVEITVAETQTVKIQLCLGLGPVPVVPLPKIEMSSGGIEIDASPTGTLTLKAGASSITLNASGITITGPLVQIN